MKTISLWLLLLLAWDAEAAYVTSTDSAEYDLKRPLESMNIKYAYEEPQLDRLPAGKCGIGGGLYVNTDFCKTSDLGSTGAAITATESVAGASASANPTVAAVFGLSLIGLGLLGLGALQIRS
ncbi:hypothetical protein [Hahella sp. NBU794]|uniref:hypothetical protein n=1 Tax=Hahella sp. NBU794 TaxID=3422590 RepID=UPI003D7017FD